ncbi:MAG: DUF4832 domain-containing protein [Paludibacteraceae bacterium]|nr:DUF4832 domain-containing protein [Paludibacteraceae bacterium]
MKRISLFVIGMLTMVGVFASSKTFTVDDDTDFWNPERGFYHYSDVKLNGQGGGGLGGGNIQSCKNDNMSLLFRYFYLDRYNTGTAITQKDLDMIANDFVVARANGVKLIVRFSYGENGYSSDNNWSFTEPSKSGMQAHMAQLKPVLAANADVIACVQAGFVGIWGEWYFSSTFGKDWSKSNAVSDRNDIINSLLDMTPADRCVQLRSVHYITEYIGNGTRNYTTNLNDQTAFSGSAQSRIGHHNDAFCADKENQGTYRDYNNERTYLANLGQYVPVGGENNEYNSTYTTGAKAMADMEQFHYDYLNTEFYSGTINNWKSQTKDGVSYYDIMKRRLGYRFQLLSATFSNEANVGGTMSVQLQMKNSGFSNLYNKRIAYIVLKGNNTTYKLPLKSDPRLWKSGQTTAINETLTLPSNISAGTYNIYINLPDMYASIADKKAYAIQLANKNMGWSNDGLNDLGMTIVIKTSGAQGGGEEGGQQGGEQGQGDDDPSHDYATSIDFMTLAAQYAPAGDKSTNGIQTELSAHYYTIASSSDGNVYWDNQSGPDGGLGIDNPNTQHDISFWVKANSKVTITVGSLNGDGDPQNGSPNTATITMNGGSAVTINANTTTEYTVTEPTLFVLSTLPDSKGWSWNRIQQITITSLPTTPLPTVHETAPVVVKYLDRRGQLHIVRDGHAYNALGL